MTLHDFISIIKISGNIDCSLENIAIELYQYSEIRLSDSTIRAVLKGKRPALCRQGWINEHGFIQYFEKRTFSTWPQMQKAFGELKECGLINRDTTDRNIFYESLLSLFYDILRFVPILLCNILPANPMIFGREKELEQLSNIFKNRNYAVLSGIGGIGKSSVALAYAYRLMESGRWTVQHMICEDSDTLQNAINKLQFRRLTDIPENEKNAVKKNFDNRIRYLKNSMRQSLIILDNLNRPFAQEDRDVLGRLAECGSHVRFLITSRSKLGDDKRCVVNLSPLDDDELLKLYVYHRFEDLNDHTDYTTQHKDVLMNLFSLIERHTLLVILLAKLPSRIFVNEHEICNRLASGWPISLQGIDINKDGEMTEIPAEGLVKMLFDISDMTDCEKSVMRYMSIMPPTGIEIKLFEKLSRCSRKEILSLKRKNWIILDEEKMTIRLHPLICETILRFDDTKPTEENSAEFIGRIEKERSMLEEKSPLWYTLSKVLVCFASNVHFRAITSIGCLGYLRDEYREALLFLNSVAKEYINSDSFEEYEPLNTLSNDDEE